MSDLVLRPDPGALDTPGHNPTDDWPPEARALAQELAQHYPAGDPFPGLAGAWIARQRTARTRQQYARQFRVWEHYARTSGTHPLHARFPLAEAFSRYLETAPTMRPVKGGRRGEMAPTGKPRSERSIANCLSACSSFYTYAVRAKAVANDTDPFSLVERPDIDADDSPTQGSTEQDVARLLAAARDHSLRAYALLLAIYTMALRVDSALGARVEDMGYDEGHRVLSVRLKGGRRKNKAIPPATGHVLDQYLAGRTSGLLFVTRTGNALSEQYVWKLIRRLATKAGLPHADSIHPHTLKHDAITHALSHPNAKLHVVQDFADHKDPRTTRIYDRRRNRLHNSPGYAIAAGIADLLETAETQEGAS